jgi:hypothetical protein
MRKELIGDASTLGISAEFVAAERVLYQVVQKLKLGCQMVIRMLSVSSRG